MPRHRSHSVAFKRQVAEEYLAGETLHGLAKRHDISRNLIRVWLAKYEAGAFDDDAKAADLLQAYEARIAALERLVGKQALELEFLKGAARSAALPRSGPRQDGDCHDHDADAPAAQAARGQEAAGAEDGGGERGGRRHERQPIREAAGPWSRGPSAGR